MFMKKMIAVGCAAALALTMAASVGAEAVPDDRTLGHSYEAEDETEWDIPDIECREDGVWVATFRS